MPSPNKGEKRSDFIYRCMSSRESIKTFNDSRQRSAFCFSQWEKSVKSQQRQLQIELPPRRPPPAEFIRKKPVKRRH